MDVIGHDHIAKCCGFVFLVQEVDAVADDLPAGFGGQEVIPMITSGGDKEALFVWEMGATAERHVVKVAVCAASGRKT